MSTAPTVPPPAAQAGRFDHLGMFYQAADDYLDGTTGFVRRALAAGDPVLVAVPGPNLRLIRDGLGRDAIGVEFADMTVAGRNPGRIIPGVLLAFAARYAGRRVSIIGEPIWPGRTVIEYPACAAHEALINVAFSDHDAAILCPYDVNGLAGLAVADAECTHPVLVERNQRRASAAYRDPVHVAAAFNRPLPAPPPGAARIRFDGYDALAGVRRFVERHAGAAGLSSAVLSDLVIAINELATNTVEHSGAAGLLSVWTEDGTLVSQVDDTGHLGDPLAGRIPPTPDQRRGRGLFLVNQLCDLVRVHTEPAGTTIRLHMTLG